MRVEGGGQIARDDTLPWMQTGSHRQRQRYEVIETGILEEVRRLLSINSCTSLVHVASRGGSQGVLQIPHVSSNGVSLAARSNGRLQKPML